MTKRNPLSKFSFDEALRRLSKVSKSEVEDSIKDDAMEVVRESKKRIKKAREEIEEGVVPKDGYRF